MSYSLHAWRMTLWCRWVSVASVVVQVGLAFKDIDTSDSYGTGIGIDVFGGGVCVVGCSAALFDEHHLSMGELLRM